MVEMGMISVEGISVADATAGIDVGVSDAAAGGTSGENVAGEQADRIRVRKRSVRINFVISD